MNDEAMKIYIIRHGETALNVKGVMQGRIDEPINQSGRDLAAVTGRAIKGIRFDNCVSSPLLRAVETAKTVLTESGNSIPIVTDERLLEIDFGDMEGKKLSDMGEAGRAFFTAPLDFGRFPNGESVYDVCERTQDFIKELIAKDDGKTYLISTHGCAMRAMLNFLTDDPSDFWRGHAPYNCSFCIVEAKGGSAALTDIDKVYYDRALIVDRFKKA